MKRVQAIVETLPEKKRYAELITAVLSVPVLISVLLLNIMSLRKANPPTNDKVAAISAQQITPAPSRIQMTPVPSTTTKTFPTPTASVSGSPTPTECKKEIGPIEIASPSEGQVITSDPVCIDLSRGGTNYCGVVWSYRLNGGSWSEYMDKAICLYNLSPGEKQIDIRVKSLAGTAEALLKRTFSIASPSATLE